MGSFASGSSAASRCRASCSRSARSPMRLPSARRRQAAHAGRDAICARARLPRRCSGASGRAGTRVAGARASMGCQPRARCGAQGEAQQNVLCQRAAGHRRRSSRHRSSTQDDASARHALAPQQVRTRMFRRSLPQRRTAKRLTRCRRGAAWLPGAPTSRTMRRRDDTTRHGGRRGPWYTGQTRPSVLCARRKRFRTRQSGSEATAPHGCAFPACFSAAARKLANRIWTRVNTTAVPPAGGPRKNLKGK